MTHGAPIRVLMLSAPGTTSYLRDPGFGLDMALLLKSALDQTSPFRGHTYPATSVMGVPRAVKPLSTVTRTWNSAT